MKNVQVDTRLFGLRLLVIQKSMGRVMECFIFILNPHSMDSYHLNFFCNPLEKMSYRPNFLINPLKGVGASLFS